MMTNKEKAVILLSGGLDCTTALACTIDKYEYDMALTFDYGQKCFEKEFISASKIAKFYNIKHKLIKLDWMKEITRTSLVSEMCIPKNINISDLKQTQESAENVWIPNRNSLFVNIAASFLDSEHGGIIVLGANREEAQTFSDNSKDFISAVNKALQFSCKRHVEVIAPLIELDKTQIAALAIKNKIPFVLINSCYSAKNGHCGECESCLRLKRALLNNNEKAIADKLFNN